LSVGRSAHRHPRGDGGSGRVVRHRVLEHSRLASRGPFRMRWIVGASLKFRFIVVGLAATMMFVGLVQLRHMPVDVFPEFAPPRVEIQTACLGLTATEVESLVTVPLEQALNGLPKLDVIRSKSVPQLSSIELIFKPATDLLHAR